MEYTKEQLAETYRKLPLKLKEAIGNIDSLEILKRIAEQFNLHIDQLGKLSDEVGLVVFGLSNFSVFTDKIQISLSLDQDTAQKIAKEINEQIFLPIREALKETTGEQTPNEQTEKTGDIFDQQMSQMFSLPKEEPAEEAIEEAPDPYHEPIE